MTRGGDDPRHRRLHGPEQARGRTVDKRADIWAFGVVLYEMLTGGRLFDGETVSDTLAAVLTTRPDWTALPAHAAACADCCERCLERDPKKRLRDIGEARFLLDEPAVAPHSRRRPRGTSKAPWALSAVLFVALLAALILLWPRARGATAGAARRRSGMPTSPTSVERGSHLARRQPARLSGAWRRWPADPGDPAPAQSKITPLAGTEGGDQPFFSPDGQWVGFFTDGSLKKVPVQGGTPVVLADASNPRGASWADDGSIVAALVNTTALWRVPPDGGPPREITTLTADEPTHRWPQVLPGSRAVLFTAHTPSLNSFEGASIDVQRLDTGNARPSGAAGITVDTCRPATGAATWCSCMKARCSASPSIRSGWKSTGRRCRCSMTWTATPVPPRDGSTRRGQVTSSIGRARSVRRWPVVWLDASGKTQPLLARESLYYSPRFSPDGRRLAL